MMDINLLPWRENKRKLEKKRVFVLLAGLSLGGLGAIFLIHTYVNYLLHKQLQHNQQLEQEIARFNRQIQYIEKLKKAQEQLSSRMMSIRTLNLTRTLPMHLFDVLIRVLPDDVYLILVQKIENKITLSGRAGSSSSVIQLMHNLEQNACINEPALIEIKKDGENKMAKDNEFTASFVLLPLNCASLRKE